MHNTILSTSTKGRVCMIQNNCSGNCIGPLNGFNVCHSTRIHVEFVCYSDNIPRHTGFKSGATCKPYSTVSRLRWTCTDIVLSVRKCFPPQSQQ